MSNKLFLGCLAALAVFALLLAGAVVPSVVNARKAQQRVEAINNLRLLTLGVQIYAADANGLTPEARDWCDRLTARVDTNAEPSLDQECLDRILRHGRCGFAINRDCAGRPLVSLNLDDVVFLPVNARGTNLSADLNSLEALWWDGRSEMELVTLGDGRRKIQRSSAVKTISGPR